MTRLVQNLIEAGLRADIQPLIRQSQYEQSRRQRGVRRLGTDGQDPLALLLTQPVNDKVRTAFTVAASKDDAPAAGQAAITNIAAVTPFSGGGGLIQTTSG